ncbi:MAG: hypothetical protein NVSMB49_23750 [Ktedonobacteraceae bacterium]
MEQCECGMQLQGHNSSSTLNIGRTIAWSPNSKYIAFGDGGKAVQVWNPVTKSLVFTYDGHSSGVTAIAWSPDGAYIASGSIDTTVRVWRVSLP